jgi:O-antigen/teichoic acid export membrane protein
MLVATSLFASDILLLVYGPGYVQAAPTLELLGASAALWIASTSPESFLISYPVTRFTRFLTGAYTPLLVNIALCLVLIPRYGTVGAAAAILVARAAHLTYIVHYCRTILPLGDLKQARILKPLVILCLAYIGCVIADQSIEHGAVKATAIVALALAGMLAAGHPELRRLWR